MKMIELLYFKDAATLVVVYEETRKKLSKLFLGDEYFWKQRAKTYWLQGGDSNTKFSHASTSIRRAQNKLKALQNVDGVRYENQEDMNRFVGNYFEGLFTTANVNCYDEVCMLLVQRFLL